MKNSGDIDKDYPTGDPTSAFCRWCNDPRTVKGDALVCDHCDSPQPLK